ncbi:MAG: tRNA (guanosine(46)-N7)-methyltransferase TrmB [Planctomycetota bacterium]|jgi:tRNA (guanine-N7-)-methyltransferase
MVRDQFQFDPALVAVGDVPSLPAAIGCDDRALHVEIGFGKDVRSLRMAERDPEARFLGVEISRKKAIKFGQKVARLGLKNVRCYWGDARKVLEEMLPAGSVDSFTVLFPDPWPKRRHHKHRWIQAQTAILLKRALKPGGHVVVATDHDGYRDHIRKVLVAAGFAETLTLDRVPEDDRTLFSERFESVGESVTYMKWELNA